jgi:hypothetical protein
MEAIELDEADLMVLDSGQGYFAGRHHNMMPVMAENYESSKDTSSLIILFLLTYFIINLCDFYVLLFSVRLPYIGNVK